MRRTFDTLQQVDEFVATLKHIVFVEILTRGGKTYFVVSYN